jgi:hypothetical protein
MGSADAIEEVLYIEDKELIYEVLEGPRERIRD